MRNGSTKGFTLIELLIVIAIIGILAAVLIPNLLNARARAFDSGAQTCLREISTQFEVQASNAPFEYDAGDFDTGVDPVTFDAGDGAEDILACERVDVAIGVDDNDEHFAAWAEHTNGTTLYVIRTGTGVQPQTEDPGYTGDDADPLPALP